VITDASGNVVLSVSGNMNRGNHRAHGVTPTPTPTPTPAQPKNTSLDVDGPATVDLGETVTVSGNANFLQDLDGDGRAGWSAADVRISLPFRWPVKESSISAGFKSNCFMTFPGVGRCVANPDPISPSSWPEEIDPVSYSFTVYCAYVGTHTLTVTATFSREDGSPVPPEKAVSNTASAEVTCIAPPSPMSLSVKSPAAACDDPAKPTKCLIDTGAQFTLSVSVNDIPSGGYIGIQTEIDYGSLLYKPATDPADEIVWPDAGFPLRSPASPTGSEGLVNLASPTSLIPPFPVSTFTGNVVEITLTCTETPSQNKIGLVPLSLDSSDASGLMDSSFLHLQFPGSDSLLINCE
jgi:hypothetical protein